MYDESYHLSQSQMEELLKRLKNPSLEKIAEREKMIQEIKDHTKIRVNGNSVIVCYDDLNLDFIKSNK